MPFEDCVDVVVNTPHSQADQHFRPLYRECLVRGRYIVDRQVRFENLVEDWKEIQELSKKHLPDLDHVTRSVLSTNKVKTEEWLLDICNLGQNMAVYSFKCRQIVKRLCFV